MLLNSKAQIYEFFLKKFFRPLIFGIIVRKTKIWKFSQSMFVYLAALYRQAYFVGTYFSRNLQGVGGGGASIKKWPTKKTVQKAQRLYMFRHTCQGKK